MHDMCKMFRDDNLGKIPAAGWCVTCPKKADGCSAEKANQPEALRVGSVIKIKVNGMRHTVKVLGYKDRIKDGDFCKFIRDGIFTETEYNETIIGSLHYHCNDKHNRDRWMLTQSIGDLISEHSCRAYIRPV